jgi:hypothetical protein
MNENKKKKTNPLIPARDFKSGRLDAPDPRWVLHFCLHLRFNSIWEKRRGEGGSQQPADELRFGYSNQHLCEVRGGGGERS